MDGSGSITSPLAGGWGDWTTEDDDPKHIYHNILVSVDPARGLNNGQPSLLAFLRS